jgi:thioredoxin-like negative regulator of GroEL
MTNSLPEMAGDLATEYWNVVAKDPARRTSAINQLKKINASNPGNTQLQATLAQLMFQNGRRDEGFAVLQEMAKTIMAAIRRLTCGISRSKTSLPAAPA